MFSAYGAYMSKVPMVPTEAESLWCICAFDVYGAYFSLVPMMSTVFTCLCACVDYVSVVTGAYMPMVLKPYGAYVDRYLCDYGSYL